MAEEEKEDVEETDETEEVQKKSPKKFIVIGVVLLLLGGGAFAGWKFFLAEKPLSDGEQMSPEAAQKAAAPGIMCSVDPFIVNLLDQGGKRYLKAQFEIEIEDESLKKELSQRMPQLRDAILMLLASKTFADISIPEGKVQLRTELTERINSILKEGAIRTLYFTEFVVQ